MNNETLSLHIKEEKLSYKRDLENYSGLEAFDMESSQDSSKRCRFSENSNIIESAGANYYEETEYKLEASNESTNQNQTNLNTNKEIVDLLNTVIKNQQGFDTRLKNLENSVKENVINKYDFSAQNKMMRENLITTKQVLKMTKLLLGENVDELEIKIASIDELEIEIASRLPLSSIAEITDLEERINNEDFENSLKTYLLKLRGTSSVDELFRRVINDKCIKEFNWDGRAGKRALQKLKLFNNIIYGIFTTMGRKNFEKEIRKSVELSHNRFKQKTRTLIKQNISNKL